MSKKVSFDTIDNQKVVGIGNNVFEPGVINVAEGQTIERGVVLKRLGGKFAVCDGTADEVPLAVMPFSLTNEGRIDSDLGFRALVGGMVRKDLLTLAGDAITAAQADALRDYGIIVCEATDVSRAGGPSSK